MIFDEAKLDELGRADLKRTPWEEVSWNTGVLWNLNEETMDEIRTAAVRDLAEDETTLDLTAVQYRFSWNSVPGTVYQITWIETFQPEDGDPVYTPCTTNIKATAESSECVITLLPPDTDGTKSLSVLKVDLAIIKPDGTEVAEADEETEGEVLQVNIDDDDGDAGSGNNPTPDKDDGNGVSGENDLIGLKLHKLEPSGLSGLTYKLHFTSSKVAVWQQNNKTQPVQSDTTTFSIANDTTVYVEGLSPSVNMDGETITLRVYNGTQLICEDKVKLIVAQMMFGIFGDGGAGEATLRTYLNGEKKDQRTDPYVIKKATACYSVFVWTSEKLAKIALGAEDGYVAYDGHSNFGIGFAFSGNLANIAAFMNVGEALVPINWVYMRDHQGHPNLWIEDAEYGDDTTTTEQYDPLTKNRSITGKLYTKNDIPEFFTAPQTGATQLHLTRGANKYEDYHYGAVDNRRIVANCGASDMPTKRWKKAFLNSCYSGQYYYRVFNHGALFYTVEESSSSGTTKSFIKAIIDGKDDDGILNDINGVENVNDYHSF